MDEDNGDIRPSTLIDSLNSEITPLRGIYAKINGIINNYINDDENFQEMRANATTVEDLTRLLDAQHQKYLEVTQKITRNLQVLNPRIQTLCEGLSGLKLPIWKLEDTIEERETDLEERNEHILDLQQEIESLRNLIADPPPFPTPLTPGQINYKNNHRIQYISDRIKVPYSLTAKSFNRLLTLTIKNPDKCPTTSIQSWRRRVIKAYALKIAPAGQRENEFRDDEYLDILRCIRRIVRNNAVGAEEVPDKLEY